MTVIPFPARPAPDRWCEHGPVGSAAAVEGRLRSPTGRLGRFEGFFRLERVSGSRQIVATGVFSGALTDADGTLIGFGSRRQRCQAVLLRLPTKAVVRIAPVDVDLLGLAVAFATVSVSVPMEALPWTAEAVAPDLRALGPRTVDR